MKCRHPVERQYRDTESGFTLVELMIVVAIIAILAGIALPTYERAMQKTRRSAAATCISEVAQKMERYRTVNMSYATAATVLNTMTACNNDAPKFYTIAFSGTPTATTFTIQATPIAGGPQVKDTGCSALGLNQTGVRSVSGTRAVADCW